MNYRHTADMDRNFGYKIPNLGTTLFDTAAHTDSSAGLATALKQSNKGNYGGVSNMYNLFSQTKDLFSTLSEDTDMSDSISRAALNHDEGSYNSLKKRQAAARTSKAEKSISSAMSIIMSIVMMAL